jgi:phage shock protein PspC (stress-responsive transcriptional regulator)
MEYELSRWVKRNDGWFCGIFEGLAFKTGINPNIFRTIWLLSLVLFGSGIFFYFILMMVVPHEDELVNYETPKFLGVCNDLSHRLNIELSLIRLFAVGSFFLTGGVVFLVYIALWMLLPRHYNYCYKRL